jgi:hypothetical protein
MTKKSYIPRGKWKSLEFRISMAKEAMRIAGTSTLPCKSRLDKIGYSKLAYAISKYDNGFPGFRRKLGERKKDDSRFRKYDDINYGLKIARKIKKKYNFSTLPCDAILRKLGYVILANKIYKKYGGFVKFRRLLGESRMQRQKGILKNLDYVLSEIKRLLDHNRLYCFPSKRILSGLDSSLAHSTVKYFGYKVVRNRFNSRYVTSLSDALERTYEFMQVHSEYNGKIPEQNVFEEHAQFDVLRAIYVAGKTLTDFREMYIKYCQEREEGK